MERHDTVKPSQGCFVHAETLELNSKIGVVLPKKSHLPSTKITKISKTRLKKPFSCSLIPFPWSPDHLIAFYVSDFVKGPDISKPQGPALNRSYLVKH
jgi:hypothetical protein